MAPRHGWGSQPGVAGVSMTLQCSIACKLISGSCKQLESAHSAYECACCWHTLPAKGFVACHLELSHHLNHALIYNINVYRVLAPDIRQSCKCGSCMLYALHSFSCLLSEVEQMQMLMLHFKLQPVWPLSPSPSCSCMQGKNQLPPARVCMHPEA